MTTENPNPAPSASTPPPTSEQTPAPNSPPASGSTAEPAKPSTPPTDLGTEEKKDEDKSGGSPASGTTDLGAEPEGEEKAKGDAEKAPWAEFHGAPAPDAEYEITAPDGFEVDDELRSAFTPVARELNLSSKGAQKLVELKAKDIQLQTERWGNHLNELRSQAQADPEIGGAKYNDSVAAGRRVISKFGTPGLRKLMNDYGVGAHPEMIRFMRKIDAAMGEPSTMQSGDGPGVVTQKPLHEILYKD